MTDSHVRRWVEGLRFCRACNWPADQQDNVERRVEPCSACRGGFDPLDESLAWSPAVRECTEWSSRPELWAYHLTLGGAFDELCESLLSLFGVADEGFREFIDRSDFGSIHSWPLITVGVGGGYTVEFLYSNFPEDYEGQVYVDHPAWPDAVLVGTVGGNFQLPAFRWDEVVRIAASAARHSGTPFDRNAQLVLWPTFYVTPDEDQGVVHLRLAEALAPWITDRMHLEPVLAELTGVIDVHWRHTERYGWACDAGHTRRTGDFAHGLGEAEAARLNEFLGHVTRGFRPRTSR